MQESYFIWDVSPDIFSIGFLTIRWYSLMWILAFFLGLKLVEWIFKKEKKNLNDVDSLFYYIILGTIIGARLGHCLFYDPEFYLTHPLEILKIWKGGLASHGAAIGMLISVFIYSKQKQYSYLWVWDRLALPVSLGTVLIRIGNFFNSEIVGIPTTVPWAIIFKQVDILPRHPTQLYEAIAYAISFFILLYLYKKMYSSNNHGFIFGFFLLSLFTARFLLEFTKTSQTSYSIWLDLKMGQWLSIPFILCAIFLMSRSILNNKK